MTIDGNPISQNFALPQNWVFNLTRTPAISYYCNAVKLPDINFGQSLVQTPFLEIPFGGDHAQFSPIELTFKVDSNFQNWQEILNWGFGISNPTGDSIIYSQLENASPTSPYTLTSDLTVIELDAQNNPILFWNFNKCRPLLLSGPKFDATLTDIPYLTSTATIKYTMFEIKIPT